MQSLQKSLLGFGAITTLSLTIGIGSNLIENKPAQAQAAYGNYVGVGLSGGLTEDNNGDGRQLAGVISGRYNLPNTPLSVRGQAFIGGGSFAFVPTVSYDFVINECNCNTIYLGLGGAFTSGDDPSPVGDRTSIVLQPGIDYFLPNSNTVIFGNAIFALDAYKNGGGTAISVQGGVGLTF